MTYYNMNSKIAKICDWKITEDICGVDICKFNNHSKVGWFLTKQEKKLLKFHTFDLKTNQEEGTFNHYEINNTIDAQVGMKNFAMVLICGRPSQTLT